MSAMEFMLVLVGVLLGAAGQLFLKAGTNRIGVFAFKLGNIAKAVLALALDPRVAAGVACYVAGVLVWILALSRVEVSIAYPMVSIGYVFNALAARVLFGEAVSRTRLGGIGIIMLGVCIVAAS